MYEYLRQHPDVFMPYRKEPVYFGSDLHKRPPYLTESSYLELFAGANEKRAVGEATVWYLYSQSAPAEIHEFAPDARIVIMVRNPVDMIHSLHSHMLFSANEEIADFSGALAAEADRRAGRRIPSTARRPEGLQYRWVGRVSPHLRRYLDTFGPERVHVIVYDDLQVDPASVYRDTLAFLGVDPSFQPEFRLVNENKRPRSELLRRLTHAHWFVSATSALPAPIHHRVWRTMKRLNIRPEPRRPLDPGLRRQLQDEFADEVADLSRLLGRDLTYWTRPVEAAA